jgi:hypothetical protein
MYTTTLTAEEFEGRKEEFSPDLFDFFWSSDFSLVVIVKLRWHNQASYLEYQGAE